MATEKGTVSEQKNTVANDQNTVSEKQETIANKEVTQSENEETQANKRATQSENTKSVKGVGGTGTTGGTGTVGTTGTSGAGSKASGIMAGISVIGGQALAGLSALSTQGTTHKTDYKDDKGNPITVESSAEAQKAAGGWAALATFAIPIFGSFIGEKIADAVSKKIDEERDRINRKTEVAQQNLSGLRGFDSMIEAMSDIGSNESIDAADKFLASIYSEENDKTRAVLQRYLGNDSPLYEVVEEIKNGNEEAYRQLQIAQLEAQKGQIVNSHANQLYNLQKKTGKAYNSYDNYSAKLNGGTIAGGGIAGMFAGAGVGALGGLAAVAAGNSWNPVGWVMMAIGATVGIGLGIWAGVKQAEADRKAAEEKRAREAKFNAMTVSEQIKDVSNTLAQAEAAGDSKLVDKCNNLIALLQEQKSLVNQINKEINGLTEEQALISAKMGDQYIQNMSTTALKAMGADAIIEAYAQAIEENGGLIGIELYDQNGNLTDSGYDYVMNALRKQGDEEINSVLNGGSYSLSEALKLRSKYGDQR